MKLNDFKRQYRRRLAPPPSKANKPHCSIVGATQDIAAGAAVIRAVKSAV